MGNSETIQNRGLYLLFLTIISLSGQVAASDDLNQYGLGSEGLSRPSNALIPQKLSNYQFIKDYEIDYRKYSAEPAVVEKNNPVLQLDVDYQDKTADLSSPFHSFNSDLTNKLNNTSNEYRTRMGYAFKHLKPEASFSYSPDSYGFGEYYNYGLGVAVPVKDLFSLETRYGWNKFDKQAEQGGINDYQDWSVGVSTDYKGMKLKVDYIDMNGSENSQDCGRLYSCEGKTVFSIIKNF